MYYGRTDVEKVLTSHYFLVCLCQFLSYKDEKNQILTTNAWLQMVTIMNNINNVILICLLEIFLHALVSCNYSDGLGSISC